MNVCRFFFSFLSFFWIGWDPRERESEYIHGTGGSGGEPVERLFGVCFVLLLLLLGDQVAQIFFLFSF